jgi:hypothetical protein
MFSRRSILFLTVTAVALTLIAGETYAGKAPKCTDIPIWVTIVPIDGGVLGGDTIGSVYKSGVDGVIYTQINICGSTTATPTYDASMSLSNSTRTMSLTFPLAITGSIINGGTMPAWAGSTIAAKPQLTIRNILWGRMNGKYTFTTRLILKSIAAPDKSTYDLRFQADGVDAMQNDPPYADTNSPNQTAKVTVQDIPGTCRQTAGGSFDSWIVNVDAPPTGTLYKWPSRNLPYQHSGQYVMPFQLKVDAQSCIPSSLTMPPTGMP